ncbi:hypothetical protein [Brevundimonas sp.]|jgi:hypothetical protein
MKIKEEFLAKEVYSKILDKMIFVSYENIDLLKNLDLNFIFEEELQPKKK